MDTKMINKSKNARRSLLGGALKWILGACLLLAGVQSVSAMECEGTIYVQLPAGWSSAIINMDGNAIKFPATMTNGWYVIDAKTLGAVYSKEFIIMEKEGGWNDGGITTNHYGVPGGPGGWDQADKFSCNDITKSGSLYIYADPTTEGKTAYTSEPPNAKYLFMLVPPTMEDWMSSTPMVSMDGGVTGSPMKAAPGMCGWYYYVWFGEEITNNVVFFRDDDPTHEDQIGMNGTWETNEKATMIPLELLFGTSDTLWFVPDEDQVETAETNAGWFTVQNPPDVEAFDGVCSYTLAAIIYDTDASLHGAFTCNPDWTSGQTPAQAAQNACYSPAAPYQVVSSATGAVPCIGITPGMVTETLDNVKGSPTYKKPILTPAGQACFGAQADVAFSAMFNPTPGVNEAYCVDVPFSKSSDNKWEFDSDFYTSPGAPVPGGFYPAEVTPSLDRFLPGSGPLVGAENKRKAEGPVFLCSGLRAIHPTEGVPYGDLLCNGPGWNGGQNCAGLFKGGSEFDGEFNGVEFQGDGWAWSCPNEAPIGWTFYTKGTEKSVGTVVKLNQIPEGKDPDSRWASGASDKTVLATGGRNQHFCFESHATFTYKPGLRFSFRGDDDIWVYIDNKLAVDLGGTHLAAPGYVDLDKFVGASGGFTEGNKYDLDIFFCDRRTTMSNVRIKTNMYIVQKTDISVNKVKVPGGGTSYEMCYNKSGDGSCAAALVGSDENITCCGDEIATKCGVTIQYVLVKGKKYSTDLPATDVRDPTTVAGIDLSDPSNPKIDKNKVNLPPGLWTLFAVIDGKHKKVESFRATGDVDVVYGDAIAVIIDENDDVLGETPYKFVGSAMGGPSEPTFDDMIPVYVSALAGEQEGKVVMQPIDAVGVTYSLSIPAGMKLFKKNGTEVTSADQLTIGDSGVDTLYAYVPMIIMSDPVQTFELKVAGREKGAVLKFYLPRITFVDEEGNPISELPEDEQEMWVGSYYEFDMVALKPNDDGTYAPCETCNFSYSLSSESSDSIEIKPNLETVFINGKATISIRSLKDYRRGVEAGKIVVIGENPAIEATFLGYFREPPVPFPKLADVFDVNGKIAGNEIAKIYSEYRADEYLDGIADSVAIYYHRRIHKDSLPLAVCILWDSTSATELNAYEKGYATMGDTLFLCNEIVTPTAEKCENVDAEGYCDNLMKFGSLKLSNAVKTSGVGSVISFATFEDVVKGEKKVVKNSFAGALTDRVAPIPLNATIVPQKGNEDYSYLTITMSEQVKLLDPNMQDPMDFYLKSSNQDSSARLVAISAIGTPTTSVDKKGRGTIELLFCTNPKKCQNTSAPQEGDFVRMGGDMANVKWTDVANTDDPDSFRDVGDALYFWNAPTGYRETKRLPSPWVIIGGRTPAYIYDVNFSHTGNASLCDSCTSVITPFVVSSMDDKEQIIKGKHGMPGQFVTSNMLAIYSSILEGDDDHDPVESVDMENFYFYYKVDYYTNLGAYVAGKSGRIYCDDKINQSKYGKTYFNGGDCTESGTYFYLAWNMQSDKGRTVGTGAYISKMETYVNTSERGKVNSKDETSVFGVKKSNVPYDRYWEDYKKNNNVSE